MLFWENKGVVSVGIIGRILRSTIEDSIREIVLEEYDGYTKKMRQVSPPGIDSNPLPEDQGAGFSVGGTSGKTVLTGVYCENCIAEPGELRFFSRDDSGAEKTFMYLKKDGTLELNGNADFAVSWTDLNTVMQLFVTAINGAFASKLDGGGTNPAITLDLTSAKNLKVKLP